MKTSHGPKDSAYIVKRYIAEWCVRGWGENGEEPIYDTKDCPTLAIAKQTATVEAKRHEIEWARVREQEHIKRGPLGWHDTDRYWVMAAYGAWEERNERE